MFAVFKSITLVLILSSLIEILRYWPILDAAFFYYSIISQITYDITNFNVASTSFLWK